MTEKENPRNLFRKILKYRYEEVEDDNNRQKEARVTELENKARLTLKFDTEIEPALLKAEQTLLEQDPICSIVSILEECAKAIEEKDIKLTMRISFDVDVIHIHPLTKQFLESWNDGIKAEFVKYIEGGKSISDAINSISLRYYLPDKRSVLSADITGIKNQVKKGEIEWRMGGYASGNIKIKDFDVYAFADLLASNVSKEAYKKWPTPEPDAQGGQSS